MFTHSQRRRAVLEAMQRVLAAVLAVQLLIGPVVQGHPHQVPTCQQVTRIHEVAVPASEVSRTVDGCGQAGNDQPGPNRPEEPDARFATIPDPADGRDERSQAERDDDDDPLR
jgi:hypothetical protein